MHIVTVIGLVLIGVACSVGGTIAYLRNPAVGLGVAGVGTILGGVLVFLGVRMERNQTSTHGNDYLKEKMRAFRTPVPGSVSTIPNPLSAGALGGAAPDMVVGEATMSQEFVEDQKAVAMPGLAEIYTRIQKGEYTGYLLVIDGPDKGNGVGLKAGAPVSLGRASGNTLQILDPGISSNQATIVVDGSKAYVTDAQSKNGTFVNNQRITSQELNNCDIIGFGATKILVTLNG